MNLASACRAADAAEAAAYVDMYAAAPTGFAASSGLRTERVAGATLLLAPGLPTPMFNRVIGLGTFEPASEQAVDAIVGRYRAAGVSEFWLSVSPAAEPPNLTQWLEVRGFSPPQRRSWVQMCRGEEPSPGLATTLEIRAAGPDEATALGTVIAAAFEMPPPMAAWLASLVGRADWQGFAALDAGTMVGGAFVHTRPPQGWLGMGAILPGHRGRHGQSALMSARIRHARRLGCKSVHTETGEPVGNEPNPSLANMVRCGFERVCSRVNYALAIK
jgi:GNAT superfamily N-acetyltransferase